ncbi:hypothetical protein [Coprococcus comes]|uniref:hypothetical protein n=1 Tax=Coprococcus comes TaxID=410072 RepID=UPI00189C1FF3|nr:hypothetical protein [Coprococcus comes]
MNGRKKYKGELYSFFRSERNIGSGGNGAVYDVEFEGDEGFEFPIVAKFFEYGGVDKEKRYNRFKNEIIALNALKGIEGIMEVIDKQCPHVVPQTKDEAWYLMPKPDELTYKDAAIITHMLRDIIPISNIFVKSLHSDQNIKQIQITDFQVGMDGICKLLYYNKGIKIKEYLLNISKMNYSNYSSVISLELNDISLVDEGYIAYSAAGHGFGNEYPRVYFSSGEKIIIKRKENL